MGRSSKLTRSVEYMYVSVVNMSKSCWFAFVLAVICLSLEADAHPTVDETCSSAALEVKIVPVHYHQNGKGKEEIEGCGKTNGTRLDEVAKEIKDEIKDEIGDVKKMITSECGENNETTLEEVTEKIKHEIGLLSDKITDVKKLLASGSGECDAAELSKQALVSALGSNCVPLLIQQNVNGSDFFNRSWAEFKVGFNDSIGNYWLGNDLLSQLTVTGSYKLKFDLQSRSNNSNWYWAEYSTFRVLTEADNYRLQVAGYSGNAGYDAVSYHNGMMFSTLDRKNDQHPGTYNCAAVFSGGFWYNRCFKCGVNGARSAGAFYWEGLPGGSYLQSSRMWLQCQ